MGVLGNSPLKQVNAAPLGRKGPSEPPSLQDIIPSTVFYVDATDAASYPGTGNTWFNLIDNPADGSSKDAYDFEFSSSNTKHWLFTGPVGDPTAYFEVPVTGLGVPRILKKGSNTTFINSWHKTTGGTPFWAVFIYQHVAGQGRFFNTAYGTNPTGILWNSNLSPFSTRVIHVVSNSFQNTGEVLTVPTGKFSIVLTSFNPLTGEVRHWVNSPTATTFTPTLNNTTTANATSTLLVGAGTLTSGPAADGTKLVGFASGNELLDNTKAASVIAFFEAKHGRTYT